MLVARYLVRAVPVAVKFASIALAKDCGIDLRVSSQSDLEANTKNCSTIGGAGISINGDFQGKFNLSGVTHVTNISMAPGQSNLVPGLSQFLMDDLVSMSGTLNATGFSSLRNLTLPKLEQADRIIISGNSNLSISFPVLLHSAFDLIGDLSSVQLPVLVNSSDIQVEPRGEFDQSYGLSLPSLRIVGNLKMTGMLSEFSMPQLETIYGNFIIHPNNLGKRKSYDFPALRSTSINSIFEISHVKYLSLPLLVSSGSMEIATSAGMEVNFPSLQDTKNINIYGSVTDVQVPVLKSVDSMHIQSAIEINCTSSSGAFRASKPTKPTDSYSCERIRLKATKTPAHVGLAMGLGLGLGFAAVMGITYLVLEFNEGINAKGNSLCDTGVGIYVKSQAELDDKITPECRTITGGGIFIEAYYEGLFNLSQITNISSILMPEEEDASVPGLTEILLDSLEYIEDTLRVRGLDDITVLALPKVSLARTIDVCGSYAGSPIYLNVPELVDVEQLYICDNVARLEFPKLKTIKAAAMYNFNLTASRGAWSFPLLAEGGDIWIDANLTSISLPFLKTMGSSLNLSLVENPLDVDLPALQAVPGNLEIRGANSMLVPALRDAGSIWVNASGNADVDFPALTTTSQIEVYGQVSNARFPKLTNLTGKLIVNSTIDVDCASASRAFSRASPPEDKGFTCGPNVIGISSSLTPSPNSPTPSPESNNTSPANSPQIDTGKQETLSKTAKIGLSVGGSLLGLCALSACALIILRHVKKSRASHGSGNLEGGGTGEVNNVPAPTKFISPVVPVGLNGGHAGIGEMDGQDYAPVPRELP
ncbi:hypothetical protein BJ875DRAFT_498455 [Amylocarpus encephaloides]|uniref:Uncharacterized protein n=1 Tax=Amylocarpus encephaloides TaxID=45428 RepID=A0A9P8C2A8_9HELO|nr:hypothetical protein BJ875DRAFT_498455 [Amylocarpus encephaloides]